MVTLQNNNNPQQKNLAQTQYFLSVLTRATVINWQLSLQHTHILLAQQIVFLWKEKLHSV